MNGKKYIVYLGSSGFPYGLAESQKMILISKSLIETGNSVLIINGNGVHKEKDYPDLKASGSFSGISYIFTSGHPFRTNGFLKRNLLKIKGLIKEFLLLKTLKKQNKLDFAILSTLNFYFVLYYVLLSKLFGFKTILNYVEYYSGIKKQWFQLFSWLNNRLFDKYAPLLVDAIFPISEFLISHVEKVAPGKKYLKVPVLTDLERFKECDLLQNDKYFLFCGSASYKEIIKFIIDSFNQLKNNSVFLNLVITGYTDSIVEIGDYINNSLQKDRIRLFSNLTETQLNSYYKNAIGLLIPLRPTLQDKARFPHKIGEYLASGNPVVSTNYGEIEYYFKDMENMLIAESYTISLFASKMQFIIDNPLEAQRIGINGRNIASRFFDYRNQAETINTFIV